jgi:acyl-CoA synthetase (AMP-forming)/AMP-acid ligase II/acyl carrier protein
VSGKEKTLVNSFMNFSTIIDVLQWRAKHQPSKVGYVFLNDGETESSSLTYQELEHKVRGIAAQLRKYTAVGDRALLIYPPGLDFIVTFLACLYAGIVATPVDMPRRNQRTQRLQKIVSDAQARVILTVTEVLLTLRASFPDNSEIQLLGTDAIKSHEVEPLEPIQVSIDMLAFLQYTSGSTGNPKGVMVSHGNLMHNEEMMKVAFQHDEQTVIVGWLPLFHDMGLIFNALQPLYLGVTSIMMPPIAFLQKPYRWLKAITDYRATTSGGPNFAYDLCVRKITPEQKAELDLSSWSLAFNGAEPVRAETLEQFADAFRACGFNLTALYPCYGMAETTLFATGSVKGSPAVIKEIDSAALLKRQIILPSNSSAGNHSLSKIVGCGQTCLGAEIAIVDPESLARCAPDRVGEIWIASESVAKGYWNQPEVTKQCFNAYLEDTGGGPFLRTGDLGFLYEGELYVTGRLKDVIIIRGRNHYPQDIEFTVGQSHPALRPGSGAAFAVEIEGQERLAIVQEIERTYLRSLDVNQVIEVVYKAVSEQHELQVYSVLLLRTGSIPKTSSGKIQRHACKAGYLAGSLDTVKAWSSDVLLTAESPPIENTNNEFEQPLDNGLVQVRTAESIQSWIVNWLSKTLKIRPESIELSKSFAEYGVDSQMSVELAQQLEAWLQSPKKIEPTIAWSFPDIGSLADHLATELTRKADIDASFPLHEKLQPSQTGRNLEIEPLSPEQVELLIGRELSELEDLLEENHR